MPDRERLSAILPCNDLDAAETFFTRLGFSYVGPESLDVAEKGAYRILADGRGGEIHLTRAVEGWLIPGANPFGLYLYRKDVDALAAKFRGEIIAAGDAPENKPWGMYEFSLNGPDDTLVRVGWPISPTAQPE